MAFYLGNVGLYDDGHLDLQQRQTQHGYWRDHPCHETENSRVILRAGPINSGGITTRGTKLMLILRVFWAEFRKSLILFMRYPFGSLITVSVMLLLFIGIFETALRVSSVEELSSDQTRLAAQKFVLWTVMILGFSSVAASIKDETQSGFIEVVWMGALHPTIVVFIRSLVSHTISIGLCAC